MSNRNRLPNCRPNETIEVVWQEHVILVTVGFDPETLEPREVFGNTGKGGSFQGTISDACVLISIALQSGVLPSELAKSLTRVPVWHLGEQRTGPASPVGAIVEAIFEAKP